MSNLANQLVLAEREDVARGIRLLLRSPMITERADPEAFDLLRRRSGPVAAWFDYHCGWSVVAEPRLGYIRLAKVGQGEGCDGTRPARRLRSGQAPFDRRRYTLLCVAAAELLPTPVTTIGLLADRMAHACGTDPVLPAFDTSRRSERMAFVDVLKLLESLGALDVIDGSAESYVDSEQAKVLFRVDAALLVRLLVAPTGPSQRAVPADEIAVRFNELIAGLLHEPRYGAAPGVGEPTHAGAQASTAAPTSPAAPSSFGAPVDAELARSEPVDAGSAADPYDDVPRSTEVQRNLWLRHSVLRRLFDDPVVYRADLSAAQRDYLGSPSGRRILHQAVEQAGFELEERAEGFLLVDPDAIATDSKFPAESASTAKTAALLLLDALLPAPTGLDSIGLGRAAQGILDQAAEWAKAYRAEGGVQRLVADACEVLTDFGLGHWAGGAFHAQPAAARYRGAEVRGDTADQTRIDPVGPTQAGIVDQPAAETERGLR